MLRTPKARLKTAECYKMETITEVDPEVDEEEMRISQYCLGLPTILRHTLQQFSTKELIKLSPVNKLWHYEASSVMKRRGNLRANISSEEDDICQQLVAFGSALENMRVIPFCGMYVYMHHPRACKSISNVLLDPSLKVIRDRLPLKHFAISFCTEWKQCEDCFALQAVEAMLAGFCGVLEELSIQEGRYEFYQDIFQDRSLSCLKTLKVKPGEFYEINDSRTNAFIKGLVTRAPNLQELHIYGPIYFTENVLEGSSAVLVHTRPFRPLIEHVCEGLISSLRVSKMELPLREYEEVDPEVLNWFIPMVLAGSRTTLTTLYMDVKFAVPFLHYGICLENVTNLYIPLNGEIYDSIQAAISELQLPTSLFRLFPKIKGAGILHDKEMGRSYFWMSHAETID